MSSKRRRRGGAPHSIPAVILAAGKGTRMAAREAKAAAEVGGKAMASRVLDAVRGVGASRVIAVVGHQAADVRAAIGDGVEYVTQEQQRGTGHAVQCAQASLASYRGPVIITYADIPLLPTDEVARLVARHIETAAAATLLTAIFDEPGTLGRIVRADDGSVRGIVEARDATPEQLAINEINVGVYCFDVPLLFETLAELTDDNAQRQLYLTDTIGILVRGCHPVQAVAVERAHTGMGVDTLDDLAKARRYSTMGEAL